VAVTPSFERVGSDATASYGIVFRNATGGVGAFDTNVTLGNASVASVTNATILADGPITTARVGGDNATVRIRSAGADTADTGAVTLARVTLRADANESTAVRLTGENVYADESNSQYDPGLANATLQVGDRGASDLTGNGQAASDVDGDGKLEDVTGEGAFDIRDVAALLEHLDSPAVTANVAAFDSNDDGTINIVDVAELLAKT
jgi:hypothetical protein